MYNCTSKSGLRNIKQNHEHLNKTSMNAHSVQILRRIDWKGYLSTKLYYSPTNVSMNKCARKNVRKDQ